jgi:hypothetical protein
MAMTSLLSAVMAQGEAEIGSNDEHGLFGVPGGRSNDYFSLLR